MPPEPRIAVPQVIVPMRRVDRATARALAYARSISRDVTVVCLVGPSSEAVSAEVRRLAHDVAVVTRPPEALEHYLDERERADGERPIAVVISDLVPRHTWHYPLHDEALRLKLRLLRRPNTVVVDVPTHV
jgi:hypothetical protein